MCNKLLMMLILYILRRLIVPIKGRGQTIESVIITVGNWLINISWLVLVCLPNISISIIGFVRSAAQVHQDIRSVVCLHDTMFASLIIRLFLVCLFSRNSVFLSKQIYWNSVSACFFSEANGAYDR